MSFFRLRPTLARVRISRPLPSQRTALRHLATDRPTTPCPSCGRPLPANLPACTGCWNIHPLPPNTTHHDLFNLPSEPNPFVIDLSTLKQRFRAAQASCHPDAWATKSSKQGDLAHTLSSRLNEAYQTLLNPLSRAEYILAQNGESMTETDKVQDNMFMMDIMEAREVIDDALPSNTLPVEHLVENNQIKMQETEDEIAQLAARHEWKEMKAATIRLRYLRGIARAGKEWLDRVG